MTGVERKVMVGCTLPSTAAITEAEHAWVGFLRLI
ncbi:hypothetical protein Rsw2DRAFT_0147 [Rhodobacter ferrooxidans]|uniref:Uncharacterized protein n=1 Tax=Rhodobacter ferrooxidans TaxID=371731 RepID=C8RWG9_9RHOB|nr:hypothetical protein Rsw2DRAFT_0147 [Rhodobacter sp. SW2]